MKSSTLYRVWIVRYEDWQPTAWTDIPPRAMTIEPADDRCLSARQAELFVKGFNQEMLRRKESRWAVRHPVALRYDGDLIPGQHIELAG